MKELRQNREMFHSGRRGLARRRPPLSTAFLRTVPLTAQDLGITLAAGLLLFAAIELEKWIARRRKGSSQPRLHEPQPIVTRPAA
jgi:hypothetical protein